MLGYWPPPFPDETLYSLCARYRGRIGDPASRAVLAELFGISRGPDMTSIPYRIDYLVKQFPPEIRMTAEDIIEHLTALPFFSRFLEAAKLNKLIEAVKGSDRESLDLRGDFVAGLKATSFQPTFLRYCPSCVCDDRSARGETYWHRLHQLGCVYVCPLHRIYLVETHVMRGEMTDTALLCADAVIPRTSYIEPLDTTDSHLSTLLWIAVQAQWLLNNWNAICDKTKLAEFYRNIMYKKGLTKSAEDLGTSQINDGINHTIPSRTLEMLLNTSKRSLRNKRWICGITRNGAGTPVQHLVMLRFLGVTVESLSVPAEPIPPPSYFESGPWPCLNPVCQFNLQNVIEEHNIVVSKDGRLAGHFACKCGYVYYRRGPDLPGTYRTKPHALLSTGEQWDSALADLWLRSELTLHEIAHRFGVGPAKIKRSLDSLGLPLKKGGRSLTPLAPLGTRERVARQNDMRERYRREYMEYRRANPTETRSQLLNEITRVVSWLRYYDREWLSTAQPAKRSGGSQKRGKTYVAWPERDCELASKVPRARHQLLDESKPPRQITQSKLLREMGYSYGNRNLKCLPRTMKAIKDALESMEECALRRFWWVLLAEESLQQSLAPLRHRLSLAEVLKRASIRPQWRSLPMFVEAIAEAQKLLSHERFDVNAAA